MMSSKISKENNISTSSAKVITTIVHIILILLAILPLLALRPAEEVKIDNKKTERVDQNQNLIEQPVATLEVNFISPSA